VICDKTKTPQATGGKIFPHKKKGMGIGAIFLPAMKLATKTPGHKVTQKVLL
jgi:hypothetical protein